MIRSPARRTNNAAKNYGPGVSPIPRQATISTPCKGLRRALSLALDGFKDLVNGLKQRTKLAHDCAIVVTTAGKLMQETTNGEIVTEVTAGKFGTDIHLRPTQRRGGRKGEQN